MARFQINRCRTTVGTSILLILLHLPVDRISAQASGPTLGQVQFQLRETDALPDRGLKASADPECSSALACEFEIDPVSAFQQTGRRRDPFPAPLQFLVGSLGAAAGGLSLGFAGSHIGRGGEFGSLPGKIMGAIVGVTVGSAAAVYRVGIHRTDGDGAFWPTLGGATVGMLSLGLVGIVANKMATGPISPVAAWIAVVAFPAIGATIGYNLSRSNTRESGLLGLTEKMPVDLWVSPDNNGGVSFGLRSSF
ncbi:MAG: hypothetical protein OEY63_04965 [Gemmatimonadota bacterium]|nr:hypothetical protein [Gemmatimonadota bacterium]